jgi:enamine deaminase RidA (YjgF/YER057c/UK114 family)
MIFISGTASIVGHQSRHAGDAVAQSVETMVNIDALIGQANDVLRNEIPGLKDNNPLRSVAANDAPAVGGFARDVLDFTIYVRRAEDEAAVRAAVTAALGSDSRAARRAIYLQADICRRELLMEIEAVGLPVATRPGSRECV